jgi:WD40 repeat protein
MPLYLPKERILARFRVTNDDEFGDVFHDEFRALLDQLGPWNCELIESFEEFVLEPDAPMESIRARADYVSDEAAWVVIHWDMPQGSAVPYREYGHPGVRVVSASSRGTSIIALSRDAAFAALAESYFPVRLLWHVWQNEEGDLKRLARTALEGDEKAILLLADALVDSGHPLAASARVVCANVLGIGQAEGLSAFPLTSSPRTLGLLPGGSAAFIHHERGFIELRYLSDWRVIPGTRHLVPELAPERGPNTAFSPCGRFLAVKASGTITCWRVHPWGLLWRLERPEAERAENVQFSPDGTMVGASSGDGKLRVWDVASGDELGACLHPRDARALNLTDAGWAFLSVDGRFGLCAPRDDAGVQWSPLPGGINCHRVNGPLASPDATRLVGRMSVGRSENIVLINVPSRKKVSSHSINGFQSPIGFTPDGRRFFTMYSDSLLAWDGHSGKPVGSVEVKGLFDRHAFSADGGTVIGWSYEGSVLRAMPIGRPDVPEPARLDLEASIRAVAVSPDGKRAVAAAPRSYDLVEVSPTGKRLAGFNFQGALAVAYSPDGLLLAGRCDGTVVLHEGNDECWHAELGAEVRCVAVSPGGGRFAAGLATGVVVLFGEDGRELWRTTAHAGPVIGLSFGGAKHLLSASAGGAVFRIDAEQGMATQEHDAGAALSSLAVSPEGITAVVVPGKKAVLFGAGGTREITSLCPFSACFVSPDVLAVGCWGEVVFLRLPGGEVIRRIAAGEAEVASVAWAERGHVLASGGWDRHLRIFRLGPMA